jgi:hypothetical protein
VAVAWETEEAGGEIRGAVTALVAIVSVLNVVRKYPINEELNALL